MTEEINATSGAIELAEAVEINLNDVEGTGKDGRIKTSDVSAFIEAKEKSDDDQTDEEKQEAEKEASEKENADEEKDNKPGPEDNPEGKDLDDDAKALEAEEAAKAEADKDAKEKDKADKARKRSKATAEAKSKAEVESNKKMVETEMPPLKSGEYVCRRYIKGDAAGNFVPGQKYTGKNIEHFLLRNAIRLVE